jgi:maltose O-acetyltransferase
MIARIVVYFARKLRKFELKYHLNKMNAGKNVKLRYPLMVKKAKNVYLGNNVSLNKNCMLLAHGGITIGDNSLIGPNVAIITVNHDYHKKGMEAHHNRIFKPVKIGNNAWIGANTVILPGVTVGDDAVIGAGSVVTKDVGKGEMVVGNPAKFKKPRFPK